MSGQHSKKQSPESWCWIEVNYYLSACPHKLRDGASNHRLNKKYPLISHTIENQVIDGFHLIFYLFLWPCLVLPWVMIFPGLYCIHHSGLDFYACQCRNAACAQHSGRNKHHKGCSLRPPDPVICGQGYRGNTILREFCAMLCRSFLLGWSGKKKRVGLSLCVVQSKLLWSSGTAKNCDFASKIISTLAKKTLAKHDDYQ